MNLAQVVSLILVLAAAVGIPASYLAAKQAVKQGRQQQLDRDEKLRKDGYEQGVQSKQAELYDLRNQLDAAREATRSAAADRDFWRGQATR